MSNPIPITYYVVDAFTGKTVAQFHSRARATAKADRLDEQCGAVRYVVSFDPQGRSFASRFGREGR